MTFDIKSASRYNFVSLEEELLLMDPDSPAIAAFMFAAPASGEP
jgi:hypothetical protein